MPLKLPNYDIQSLRRDEFPFSLAASYLNHASISPIPQRSMRAGQETLQKLTGNAFQYFHDGLLPLEEAYSAQLAAYINAESADEIVYMRSTSDGINAVAQAIDWKPDDEIIFHKTEFPSNAFPWFALEREGVRCKTVSSASGTLDVAHTGSGYYTTNAACCG